LLSHLKPHTNASKTLLERLLLKVDAIDQSTTSAKYPIQEKYLALLYYAISKIFKRIYSEKDESLELWQTSKLFNLAVGGLASSL
jgi:hypothetical protein